VTVAAHERSIADIARAVRAGELRAADVVASSLAAIRNTESSDRRLHAFLAIADGRALEDAAAIDARVSAGEPVGRLAGVPIAIKDNICTLDLPTTCGSRILEGYRSPYDATAVRRLRAEGAIVVGKTNLDEFAMGSSTENSAFGPALNPHDRARVPGGSSGGSAAAVAARLVPGALGSETGGSVRQPAAFCGLAGTKPTYGRVSRYGLVAFASSLDQIGTFARNIADAALLLEVIAGHDPLDSTSVPREVPDWVTATQNGVQDLVIGVPREYFPPGLHPRIAAACRSALDALEREGATLREVSLPNTALAIPTYYVLAPAEASSNLARYDGVRYGVRAEGAHSAAEVYASTRSHGFGPEVKRRIMLGTYALSAGYYDAYYARAQRMRTRIAHELTTAFRSGVDALFTPTTPTPAFRIGEKTADPYEMYLSDIFTVTANLAGVPAVSVPIGTVDGLPVGGQIIAAHWCEDVMLRIAGCLERVRGSDEAARHAALRSADAP
jgi:aspartyl-tRNA(Asn)/glutamyl-tRNA(Gln) amidotransferase subunit A